MNTKRQIAMSTAQLVSNLPVINQRILNFDDDVCLWQQLSADARQDAVSVLSQMLGRTHQRDTSTGESR